MEESLSSENESKNSTYSRKNSGNIEQKNEAANEKSFLISKIISEIFIVKCEEGKSNMESKTNLLNSFISRKIPKISIKDFIDRLLKYSKTFHEIAVIIFIYIDKICNKHKINLNYYNIHKLIFAAFIVAIKFHEDENYSMSYYAKLGGISTKEAIKLEYEFISLIDFKLFVEQKVYDKYYSYLHSLDENEDDLFDDDFNMLM
jgi:hypothetical protein